jgi:hypothetical protein
MPSKTLRWWGMRGLYGWANIVNDGRGIHREYELDQLYQFGIAEELSSLNIPVKTIERIMCKHFRLGLVMYPPHLTEDDLEPEDEEFQEVNVAEQMDKLLVISKTLSATYNLITRIPPEDKSFPSDRTEAINISDPDGELLDSVMIVINLKRIKNIVDSLIRNFCGPRPNIPPDI